MSSERPQSTPDLFSKDVTLEQLGEKLIGMQIKSETGSVQIKKTQVYSKVDNADSRYKNVHDARAAGVLFAVVVNGQYLPLISAYDEGGLGACVRITKVVIEGKEVTGSKLFDHLGIDKETAKEGILLSSNENEGVLRLTSLSESEEETQKPITLKEEASDFFTRLEQRDEQ